MLLVDNQAGSKDLYPYIRQLTSDAILTRIDPPFGDIVWAGNGPDDKPCMVAVEYKKFSELLDSQISGRFVGHQLGGLILHYDRRYLLVEGRIRVDRNTGLVQEQRGDRWRDVQRKGAGLTFRELEGWYTTIEEMTQTRIVHSFDQYESARWLFVKHSWWVNKGWDEHTALHQFHVPQPEVAALVKPNLVRRCAKELTGVRWERSAAVAATFQSVREMANANEQTWLGIDGIGKVLASRIVAEINGRNK